MSRLINIGFGNVVNSDKITAVVSPDAAPIKRLVQNAKGNGAVIDATQGRKTKAVIVLEGGQLLLSALQPETIARRFSEPGGAELSGKTEACAGESHSKTARREEKLP